MMCYIDAADRSNQLIYANKNGGIADNHHLDLSPIAARTTSKGGDESWEVNPLYVPRPQLSEHRPSSTFESSPPPFHPPSEDEAAALLTSKTSIHSAGHGDPENLLPEENEFWVDVEASDSSALVPKASDDVENNTEDSSGGDSQNRDKGGEALIPKKEINKGLSTLSHGSDLDERASIAGSMERLNSKGCVDNFTRTTVGILHPDDRGSWDLYILLLMFWVCTVSPYVICFGITVSVTSKTPFNLGTSLGWLQIFVEKYLIRVSESHTLYPTVTTRRSSTNHQKEGSGPFCILRRDAPYTSK